MLEKVMKEYGGYIELDEFYGTEYYENCLSFNSGRSCLGYLIEKRDIKKLYLPYFLCDTVKETCERYKIKYEYYYIKSNFEPNFSKKIGENEYLYVVNFYGQLSFEYINYLNSIYKNLILDNAQDFFRTPIDGMDTIYICRKYFGVADGAYLFSKDNFEQEYPIDTSYDRMNFLLGRFEKDAASFYSEYLKNNNYFASGPIMRTSKLSRNILRAINYERIKKIRTDNFMFLYSEFWNQNQLLLNPTEGAFAYPLLVDNGDVIRKKLIANKIYIPTLWPEVFKKCGKKTLEYRYAKDILPIPVDQRYNIEDMKFLSNEIKRLVNKAVLL